MELRKFVAPEFIFGEGALDLAGRYARNFNARKALIVTDPGVLEAGWPQEVMNSLSDSQIPYAVFSELTPNPKDHEVMSGVRLYKEAECDIIVAVGGGSPMDCAKGIGICVTNQKEVLEFEGVDRVPVPGPPLICIPTTAGSSADVSQFAIITDTTRQVKIAIISKTMVPDVSLIDPQTTTTMSAELTAATGMDALVHAFEAYVSNASSPVTDLNAMEAIRLVRRHLQDAIAHPLDLENRDGMMMGSLLAGLAFSNASLGLVHSMAHSLGGFLDLAHGDCNAILLDRVVDFNYNSAIEKYQNIARLFHITDQDKETLLKELSAFRRSVGIDFTLRDLGVEAGDLPDLARFASQDPCLATNPVNVSQEDIQTIYEKALS